MRGLDLGSHWLILRRQVLDVAHGRFHGGADGVAHVFESPRAPGMPPAPAGQPGSSIESTVPQDLGDRVARGRYHVSTGRSPFLDGLGRRSESLDTRID